jgi:hypothetical protein
MSKTVTALYTHPAEAEIAAQRLHAGGVAVDDISIMMSDGTRGREWGVAESSKAAEGAAVGAVTGGLLGALAAGLVAVGTISTGGAGIVAAGPLVAALAGAGAGGAAGTVVGGLLGMGIPEHEAKLVEEELARGKVLLGVKAHDDRVDRVEEILEDTGGTNVRS